MGFLHRSAQKVKYLWKELAEEPACVWFYDALEAYFQHPKTLAQPKNSTHTSLTRLHQFTVHSEGVNATTGGVLRQHSPQGDSTDCFLRPPYKTLSMFWLFFFFIISHHIKFANRLIPILASIGARMDGNNSPIRKLKYWQVSQRLSPVRLYFSPITFPPILTLPLSVNR